MIRDQIRIIRKFAIFFSDMFLWMMLTISRTTQLTGIQLTENIVNNCNKTLKCGYGKDINHNPDVTIKQSFEGLTGE